MIAFIQEFRGRWEFVPDISDTFGLHDTSFNPVIGRSVMEKVYQKQTT